MRREEVWHSDAGLFIFFSSPASHVDFWGNLSLLSETSPSFKMTHLTSTVTSFLSYSHLGSSTAIQSSIIKHEHQLLSWFFTRQMCLFLSVWSWEHVSAGPARMREWPYNHKHSRFPWGIFSHANLRCLFSPGITQCCACWACVFV